MDRRDDWASMLSDITLPPAKPLNPEAVHWGRVVPVAHFRLAAHPHQVPMLQKFDEIMEQLTRRATDLDTDIIRPEKLVLGPEQIEKYAKLRRGLTASRLLTYHKLPTTTLVVEARWTRKNLLRDFEQKPAEDESLSLPHNEVMVFCQGGKNPIMVREAAETNVALVKECSGLPPRMSPEEYYTQKTNYDVISSRRLTHPEKMSMEIRTKKTNMLGENVRLLEFKNPIERNGATAARHVEFVEGVYNNSALYNGQEVFTECQLLVDFPDASQLGIEFLWKLLTCVLHNLVKIDNDEPGVIHTDQLPFHVVVIGKRTFRVHFLDPNKAEGVIKELIGHENGRSLFYTYETGRLKPKLTPLFRKSAPIHRDVRAVLNHTIHLHGDVVGELFGDRLKSTDEAEYLGLRLYEEWDGEDEIGLIGVEGWDASEVHLQFEELRRLFVPARFNCTGHHTELLFGVGEAFVRSLAEEYHVLVDVDKFRGALHVFGPQRKAQEVIEAMQTFVTHQAYLEIDVDIPTTPPFFNDPSLISSEDVENIGSSLGADCHFRGSEIRFQGPLETYKILVSNLQQVSSHCFDRLAKQLKIEPGAACPICLSEEISDSEDFFRQSCGHSMCRTCCNRKVELALNDSNFQTTCDTDGCGRVWTPRDFMNVILGDERRIKALDGEKLAVFQTAVKRAIVVNDENVESCPEASCSALMIRDPGNPRVSCNNSECQHVYCGDCLAPSHGRLSCGLIAQARQSDDSMREFMKKNDVQVCPQCKSWVQKNGGCHHMQCRCGQHFCWLCGLAANDEKACNRHLIDVHGRIGGIDPEELALLELGFPMQNRGFEVTDSDGEIEFDDDDW